MADRRLHVFYTVAKAMSFTKAADRLHMTQPAVTFQVRQLETHFGTRLFDRTHKKIRLTAVGELVYLHASQIFELYKTMENTVRNMTGEVNGVLTLGASTTIAEYLLPVLLSEFKSKHNEVNIQLKVSNTEGIVDMVSNNLIDLGVVEGPVHNKNLIVDIYQPDQMVLVVSPLHPLATRKFVGINSFINESFVCREEGSGTRDVILTYMHQHSDKELNVTMELGSLESIKGAVEAGMGVSILSLASVAKELKLNTLVALPLKPTLQRNFSFVHQKRKFKQRAMEEWLTFAKQHLK